jgi:hypothetical protein
VRHDTVRIRGYGQMQGFVMWSSAGVVWSSAGVVWSSAGVCVVKCRGLCSSHFELLMGIWSSGGFTIYQSVFTMKIFNYGT